MKKIIYICLICCLFIMRVNAASSVSGNYSYYYSNNENVRTIELRILNNNELVLASSIGTEGVEYTKGTYTISGNTLTYTRVYQNVNGDGGETWQVCTGNCKEDTPIIFNVDFDKNTLSITNYFNDFGYADMESNMVLDSNYNIIWDNFKKSFNDVDSHSNKNISSIITRNGENIRIESTYESDSRKSIINFKYKNGILTYIPNSEINENNINEYIEEIIMFF